MEEIKVNNAMRFEALKELAEAAGRTDLAEFCEAQIASIAAKNEKNKARAAEKRRIGDELQAQVLSLLSDTPQTKDDLCAAIGDPDVTPSKIVSKMRNLIEAGQAVKALAKNEEGKKVTVYTLA